MTGNYVKTDVISCDSNNNTTFHSNLKTSLFSRIILSKAKQSLLNKLLFSYFGDFAINSSFLNKKLFPMYEISQNIIYIENQGIAKIFLM